MMPANNPWKKFVERIKLNAPTFPQVDIGTSPDPYNPFENIHYINTMVRIKRNGTWYKVHYVNTYKGVSPEVVLGFMQSVIRDAYNIIHLWRICGLEDIDSDQTDEDIRISDLVLSKEN